jgi:hypothetical protein
VSYWDYEPVRHPLISDSMEESQAFGMSVIRANYSSWNGIDSELEAVIEANDLVILRTRDVKPFDTLDGSTFITAGTLTYWASQVNPEFEAGNSDYILIHDLVGNSRSDFFAVLKDSFSSYTNHYDFNPTLRGLSTTDAYLRWAMSRINSNALTGLLNFQDKPIGAVSAIQHRALVEVEIAGIVSSAQGQGHYAHLIGQLWNMVNQPQTSQIVISTQIENRNVQTAWAKMGLTPQFEVHTTHVMHAKK